MHAIRTLLANVVDYAGLFPPAKLEMAPTIANYAAYRASPHAWMLGRLVVPVARFDEFERLAAGKLPIVSGPTHDDAWAITALTASPSDPQFSKDIDRIERFNDEHASEGSGAAYVDCIEVKVTTAAEVDSAIDRVTDDLFPYFEVPVDADPRGLIAAMAGLDVGAKIRTGGLVPDAHPSCDAVAGFILACAAVEVPFKATAGLHHPLRHHAADVGCKQHGFLNVFVGAALAFTGKVDRDELTALLAEEATNGGGGSRSPIAILGDGVAWRDRRLTVGEVRHARDAFVHAFGSCSFEEPRADLVSLGLLEESRAN